MSRLARAASVLYAGISAVVVSVASVTILQAAGVPEQGGASKLAQQIFSTTGVTGGVIVHLGCGDGQLTAALRSSDRFLVQGLDADAENIEAARKHIRALGLYGRMSVERFAGSRLPYADNTVNLVVAEDLGAVSAEEVMRVLVPLGAACVRKDGQWTKTAKPWPNEIDEWTHYLHGPDNNAVAHDRLVGPPQGVQWLEGPYWQRHHQMNANPNAMVSAQGRLFYIYDEAPATIVGMPDHWVLVARDAFNGLLLWKRPIDEWGWKAWSSDETGGRFNLPLHIPRRLVADGDRVFVTLGFNAPLTALDAATGKTLKTYEGTELTDEILFYQGLLVLSVNEAPQRPDTRNKHELKKSQKQPNAGSQPAAVESLPSVKKRIVVVDAESGKTIWTHGGFAGVSSSPIAGNMEHISRLLMAVGGGKVVAVEKDALVAFDLTSGREIWRTARPPFRVWPGRQRESLANFSSVVVHEDVLLFLQTDESYKSEENSGKEGVRCTLVGLALDTGKLLWTLPCSKWGPASEGDIFAIEDLVWTHAQGEFALIGVDIHTGQIQRRIDTKEVFDEVHHHRCFRNKATDRYVLTARRGIETIDLRQEQITKNEWVRGACRYGIMPCNGLIYVPPHPCQCYIDVKLNGFYALSSGTKLPADNEPRLVRGPAYGSASNPQSRIPNPSDWPTYRHDTRRSGSTAAVAPAELKHLWASPLGSRPSACTVAEGKVFAAVVDEHRVVALDERDGRPVWEYTVGGRVDTPPTLYHGLVLFGSADGWVYCLRASDGELAWRFRAAPQERRIVAMGQLESLWPVHGSVLVDQGVACVAAGRSTHLDGGIRLFALKPETGEVAGQLRPSAEAFQGLDDVLTGDGQRVYMRNLEFLLKLDRTAETSAANGTLRAGLRGYSTAGMLDDSCFARIGWTTKIDVSSKGNKRSSPFDLLVFDSQSTYGFRSRRVGGFGGYFQAGTGAYELSATDLAGKRRWETTIPLRVRAMAVAGEKIVIVGPRDVVNPHDPWASVEGRAGSVVSVLSAADGKKTAEYALDAAPVWDGLAIGDNRLLVSTLDGQVICLGAK